MKHVTLTILAGAILAASTPSARADVLPARRAADADRSTIERRLVERGLDPTSARSETARLTSEEARYFAESPDRVQAAGHGGDLFWLGCCGGGVLLLAVLILIAL
ncbi:MAG: hypothetical protein HYY16_14950 [Planctomycetes bacterium]|nr:hypothetical protein [Planctomycetota bacterium]